MHNQIQRCKPSLSQDTIVFNILHFNCISYDSFLIYSSRKTKSERQGFYPTPHLLPLSCH